MKILLFSDPVADDISLSLTPEIKDRITLIDSVKERQPPKDYYQKLYDLATDSQRFIITLFPDELFAGGFNFEKIKQTKGNIYTVNNLEEALLVAKSHRRQAVVFPATGFDHLSAAVAAALIKAKMAGIRNFRILNDLRSGEALLKHLLTKHPGTDGVLITEALANILGKEKIIEISRDYKVYFAVANKDDAAEKINLLSANIQARNQRNLLNADIRDFPNKLLMSVIEEVFQRKDGFWETEGTVKTGRYILREGYKTFGIDEYKN